MLSNIIVAVGGLAFISLIAKKLPINEFGIFAVIQTYVLAVNSLINFQTWYTIVKYLPSIKNDMKLFNSLMKYSYTLDLMTSLIGTIIGIVLIYFLGSLLNIPEKYYFLVQIFSFSILVNITGTATGYFRSIDNYKVFLYSDIISTFIKVFGALFAYIYFPTIEYFLIVLLFSYASKSFYLNFIFLYGRISDILKSDTNLIKNEFKNIKEYSWVTSVTGAFDVIFRQADTLIVSAFFGVHYAGIFKMIKTFIGLITQITTPIYLVLFPMVNEYVVGNKKQELKKVTYKSILVFSILGIFTYLIFLFLEDWLIINLFNISYLQYTNYLNVYLGITVVSVVFTIVHPITNLIGLHKETMYLTIVKLFTFILLVYLIQNIYGFYGFLFAVFLETATTIVVKLNWINRWFKKI